MVKNSFIWFNLYFIYQNQSEENKQTTNSNNRLALDTQTSFANKKYEH